MAAITRGKVYILRSAKLYFDGLCTEDRLHSEVIPKLKQHIRSGHNLELPMVVEAYLSKEAPVAQWPKCPRRKLENKTRRLEFFIDERYHVSRVNDDGTIHTFPK